MWLTLLIPTDYSTAISRFYHRVMIKFQRKVCKKLIFVRNCKHVTFFCWLASAIFTRFGSGDVLPSWIDTGIWSMPNERHTFRGLRTDLGKILSIWPFENSTTVLVDFHYDNFETVRQIFKNLVEFWNWGQHGICARFLRFWINYRHKIYFFHMI